MIPFLKSPLFNLEGIHNRLRVAQEARHWANHGPCERALQEQIEKMCQTPVVCVTNATIAIEILHRMMWSQNRTSAYLPTFTFPATNLSVPAVQRRWVEPITAPGQFVGHTDRKDFEEQSYQVITIPFGDPGASMPDSPRDKMPCFVDAAAGVSPNMHLVRHWLRAEGADAVVVSLHATKLWPAGEGGFVAFQSREMADEFRSLINFGFTGKVKNRSVGIWGGTNAKMSELSAACALANLSLFEREWERRTVFSMELRHVCKNQDTDCIASPQSFWFLSPLPHQETCTWFQDKGIEARNYYVASPWTPASICTENGVCLPVWPESQPEQETIISALKEFLDENANLSPRG